MILKVDMIGSDRKGRDASCYKSAAMQNKNAL